MSDLIYQTIKVERLTGADETAGLRWAGVSRSGFVLNYTPVDVADNLRDPDYFH